MNHIKRLFCISVFALVFLSVTAFKGGEKYGMDKSHSYISFTIRHMVINKVRGDFKEFSVEINLDDKDMSKSSVEVVVQAASINTNHQGRDKDLRGESFFEVEKYPEITLKSKKIKKKGDGYIATADLTMHGVTREIEFPFTMSEMVEGERRGKKYKRFSVEGSFTVNRMDYGISWSRTIDTGGLIAGKEVTIDFAVAAVRSE